MTAFAVTYRCAMSLQRPTTRLYWRRGHPEGFSFATPHEIFEELRIASTGEVANYSGIAQPFVI